MVSDIGSIRFDLVSIFIFLYIVPTHLLQDIPNDNRFFEKRKSKKVIHCWSYFFQFNKEEGLYL